MKIHMDNQKKRNRAAAGLICLGMTMSICGCGQNAAVQQNTEEKTEDVRELARAVLPEEPVFQTEDDRWDYSSEKREKLTDSFTEAYDTFAVETIAEVAKSSSENMVYSPLSLYYALALASSGAEGETKEQMLDILGYEQEEELMNDCKSSFEALYHVPKEENSKANEWGEYPAESRYMLTLANSLWVDDSLQLEEEFTDRGASFFYADIFQGNLQSQEAAEAKALWVKERTNGIIEPKAEPAAAESMLSIINTIYFYDEWSTRFDVENTKEDTFICEDGTEVYCDFMNMEMGSHGFRKGENYTESSLALKNGTMTFYLPDAGINVRELVEDEETLDRMLNSDLPYTSGQVIWQVPKFSYGNELSLAEMLQTLGLEDAFEESADFSGISDQGPLFISDIMQNAHLGIDENGVEGAAYTEILFCGAAMPQGKAEMILDRPFFYTVRNNGQVIFAGICENPAP